MQIGILTAGHVLPVMEKEVGTYHDMFVRLLGAHGFTFRNWNVVDGDFPAGPDAADGWLITGSRHGVYDELPFIPRLEAFVRDIAAAEKPLVGICFGHQVMAQALGGKVAKFAGGWSNGRKAYDWGGETLYLNAWHQDQVMEPPQGAEVIARNEFCRYAALRYSPRMMSVQPHPEFDDAVIAQLLEHRSKGVLPQALIDGARDELGKPIDAGRIAGELARALKGEPA
jgi:GMP synthase (glutamine-hydrolysing)